MRVTVTTWRSDELLAWLTPTASGSSPYRHLLLVEDAAAQAEGLTSLARLVREAHRDARERLERLTSRSLDPLDPSRLPGHPSFPDDLETTTLQGYLGEVLAGLVAENYLPHGRQWQVPAFLFRGHLSAFQALERARQQQTPVGATPGRTGDDALAFEVDEDGAVTSWLFGEAKCTARHDAGMIADGHEKLSAPDWLPIDLAQLIDVLESRDDVEARRWADALRSLNFATPDSAPPRFDMLLYACGQKPASASRDSWMSTEAPHEKYTGGKPLEAVEVQFDDFVVVLAAAYPGAP
jgi:hypothetical protein